MGLMKGNLSFEFMIYLHQSIFLVYEINIWTYYLKETQLKLSYMVKVHSLFSFQCI